MTTPTETPLTDAMIAEIRLNPRKGGCIPKDFARALEKKLTAANAELKRQQDRINELEAMLVTYGHR